MVYGVLSATLASGIPSTRKSCGISCWGPPGNQFLCYGKWSPESQVKFKANGFVLEEYSWEGLGAVSYLYFHGDCRLSGVQAELW